jgi:hypothetical protein
MELFESEVEASPIELGSFPASAVEGAILPPHSQDQFQ